MFFIPLFINLCIVCLGCFSLLQILSLELQDCWTHSVDRITRYHLILVDLGHLGELYFYVYTTQSSKWLSFHFCVLLPSKHICLDLGILAHNSNLCNITEKDPILIFLLFGSSGFFERSV